jgi:hypothetical protein
MRQYAENFAIITRYLLYFILMFVIYICYNKSLVKKGIHSCTESKVSVISISFIVMVYMYYTMTQTTSIHFCCLFPVFSC